MQVRSRVSDATVAIRRGLSIVGALLALGVTFAAQGCGSSGSGGSRHVGSSVRLEGRVVDGSGSLAALSGVRADASVVGVTVTATQDGVTVDSTETGVEGTFQLAVMPGLVTLRFMAQGVDVSNGLTVPEGASFAITVTLTPDAATVDDAVLTRSALACESGELGLDLGATTSLVIDGDGQACVRTVGNCAVSVRARELTLKDCGNCVDAQGTSDVNLVSVDGDLSCESSGNGIDAGGTPNVHLSSAGELTIEAGGDHAIAATGNATVAIESPVSCLVHGRDGAIHAQGGATVTTDGCVVLDSGDSG